MSSPGEITVRRMQFDFPDDVDPLVVAGDPEQSYTVIGLSLLLPYLEPYLIRTMKQAKPRIDDPALVDDLERFSAQEGQHYRQHMRFNEVVRRRLPDLHALEEELDADYRRFSREKSLQFNLAYAEGFEALTTAAARFSFERGLGDMHPAIGDLFTWHLVEELEHRTVAFDVYDHIYGGYFYRLRAGLYAQWHMARFIARVTSHLLANTPDAIAANGGDAGLRERRRMRGKDVLRRLVPKVLATYLPWYTPHRIEMPQSLVEMGARYTERAERVS